ncbi:hypothetical protein [Dactylosporangium sp. NPDC005555]|uniref:hypothetical protein n=1 Tax=Dactylosporangium sp. NPDC005555 TaxID=3154889 RepID=UPI00339FF434
MGGRSYMLATRMPMSRTGFDAWLGTPPPGLDVIGNPADMWTGWDNDGDGARFTARHPVDALIEELRPVEAAFLAAAQFETDDGWDPTDVLDPAIRASAGR